MINDEDHHQAFMDRSMKTLSEGDVDTFTSLWAEDRIHQSIYPFDPAEIKREREAIHTYAKA